MLLAAPFPVLFSRRSISFTSRVKLGSRASRQPRASPGRAWKEGCPGKARQDPLPLHWSSFIQPNRRFVSSSAWPARPPGLCPGALPSALAIQLAAAEQMERIRARLASLRPLPQREGC